MKPITKLKEQARLLEQKEEWEKAAQLYLQILRHSEQEDEIAVDLALYNRIGDLYLKLGKAEEAVTFYEQAADHYASDGLFNNAIALCNKALRHLPDRLSLYRKLGRLSASQGFITDSRRWFFEFAERQIKRGALDEAFEALRELADRTDDAEVRELLARQLQAHGRTGDSIAEYRRAFASRIRGGDPVGADALREEIRGIDPAAADTLEADITAAPATADLGDSLPLLPELGLETAAGAAGISDTLPGLDEIAEATPPPDLVPAPEPLQLEAADLIESDAAEPLPIEIAPAMDLETDTADLLTDDRQPESPLPLLPAADEDTWDSEPEGLESLPLLDTGEVVTPLPLLGEGDQEQAPPPLPFFEDEPEEVTPLPLLAAPEPVPLLDAVVRLPETPEPPPLDAARALYLRGHRVEGRAALEDLVASAETAGDRDATLTAMAALVELEPQNVSLHQRYVETSFRLVGARGAVDALLGLAAALAGAGLASKASVAYQQVLDIDPTNATAGDALRRERAARPLPRDDGNYIDLGALLLEDAEPEKTRYVVDAAPTGDEERDFVEMLEQFKDKVAEHMGEDPQAHYDLGLAYKEMGLVDEAISEFQIALRNGQDRLRVFEELGRCFLLKGQPNIALRVLQQALELPREGEMAVMGVYYLLGCAQEELGNPDGARDAYERVVGLDMQFQDVAKRLARL